MPGLGHTIVGGSVQVWIGREWKVTNWKCFCTLNKNAQVLLETDESFWKWQTSYLDYQIPCKCFGASEAASQQRPYLVQFILARFYQNVSQIVHERYQAR